MRERAIRVVYFEPSNQARLVAEALGPAGLQLARDAGARVHLRTHWARGQHYDLVIGRYDEVLGRHLDAAGATIRAWLERNPSTASLPADHRERSRRMADAEQWRGAIEPPYADNDVVLTSDVRSTLWDSAALGLAASAFHADVLTEVVNLAAARRHSRADLILRAARLLASVGHMAAGGDFAFWPTSLSAHARLFLTAHPSLRPSFEAAWDRLGTSVAIGDLMTSSDTPEDLAGWIAAGAELGAAVARIQEDGREALMPIDVDNPLHIRETLGSDEAVTTRLTALFDADRHQAVVASPRHRRFRIVVNVMYEALAVATLSPVERALACYLIARAILADFPDMAARARDAIADLAETAFA